MWLLTNPNILTDKNLKDWGYKKIKKIFLQNSIETNGLQDRKRLYIIQWSLETCKPMWYIFVLSICLNVLKIFFPTNSYIGTYIGL